MHSKAKGPTKAERERMARIIASGCVACQMGGDDFPFRVPGHTEIHHLLDGGVRRGHSATIGLCMWHHQGRAFTEGQKTAVYARCYGPSLYHDARGFRARYGSDDELLAYQNRLLEDRLEG